MTENCPSCGRMGNYHHAKCPYNRTVAQERRTLELAREWRERLLELALQRHLSPLGKRLKRNSPVVEATGEGWFLGQPMFALVS